tara:strand:- start:872 stop:1732 length:861 start_codon:yes stop_codon:yes gene_type:complete
MDQYIRYHKKPYAKYLDVQSFNAKYGTDIKDVEDFDLYFHYTFHVARQKQGPDDFLMANFMNHDQFIEFMATKKGKKKKSSWGILKAISGAAGALKQGIKDQINEARNIAGDVADRVKKATAKTPKKTPTKKEVDDLDGLLSDDENMVEEEYDEETEETLETEEVAATPAPVKNIVTEKKKIADLVLKTSKDSEEYSQDMKHLIQFKSAKLPLEEQLMKGRPKYLKALKAYLKGDKDVEVKMSWSNHGKGRKKGRMVRVADLNPKRDSLKALLRSSPGSLRVVECV